MVSKVIHRLFILFREKYIKIFIGYGGGGGGGGGGDPSLGPSAFGGGGFNNGRSGGEIGPDGKLVGTVVANAKGDMGNTAANALSTSGTLDTY
jgi:hypothetical protein